MLICTYNIKNIIQDERYLSLLSSLQIVDHRTICVQSCSILSQPFSIVISSIVRSFPRRYVRNTCYSSWELSSREITVKRFHLKRAFSREVRARVVLTLDIFQDGDLDLCICRVPLERKRCSFNTYKIASAKMSFEGEVIQRSAKHAIAVTMLKSRCNMVIILR